MDQHVLDDLSAYMDRELTPEEEARVALHLEDCTSCREMYRELSTVSLAIREQWISLEPSVEAVDQIWIMIEEEKNRRKRNLAWLTTGSLVACLLLVTGLFLSPWGEIMSRSIGALSHMIWTGLTVLAAMGTLSPYAVVGYLAVASCLLIGSLWGVRKLIAGLTMGEAT